MNYVNLIEEWCIQEDYHYVQWGGARSVTGAPTEWVCSWVENLFLDRQGILCAVCENDPKLIEGSLFKIDLNDPELFKLLKNFVEIHKHHLPEEM